MINIVIADPDERYFKKTINYMLHKDGSLDVSLFSTYEHLIKFLESNSSAKIDIFMISQEMYTGELNKFNFSTKILMNDGSEAKKVSGWTNINKYKKTDLLINEVLMSYSDRLKDVLVKSGGQKNPKLFAFYSPVGGSGKTTLSLSFAKVAASMGHNVFYLCLETISSQHAVLSIDDSKDNLRQLLLRLKIRNADLRLKIKSMTCVDKATNIQYFNNYGCAFDINEIQSSEIANLLVAFRDYREHDFIIIDLPSTYNEFAFSVLRESDVILNPLICDELSVEKTRQYLNEFKSKSGILNFEMKNKYILNKANSIIRIDDIPFYKTVAEATFYSSRLLAEELPKELASPMHAILNDFKDR